MFIKAFVSLALAGAALATPTQVYERDLPTVTNALASVNSAGAALDSAVNSFSGAADVAGLQSAGAALLSAINDANDKIGASAQLSLTDAIGLQSASGGLTTSAQSLVNDIIAKKPAFDAACVSPAVLDQLQKQKAASATLAATIVSKLPDALQSIGQSQSGGVTDAVQKGIDAYQGSSSSSCSSSGSSGSGSATTSAAAAAPPASSAAAAPPASSAAAAAPSSAAAPPPAGYGSGSASSSSSASSKPSGVASPTGSKTTPTPSPSGSSIVPYTGAAAPQHVATGFMGVAAVAALFAVAL